MIVADSTLAACLFLGDDTARAVENLLRRDGEWAAPVVWRSEMISLLSGLVRSGRASLATARMIMDKAALLYSGREYAVPHFEVVTLANSSSCDPMACEYAALAYALGLPLVSLDESVLAAFADIAVSPEDFL